MYEKRTILNKYRSNSPGQNHTTERALKFTREGKSTSSSSSTLRVAAKTETVVIVVEVEVEVETINCSELYKGGHCSVERFARGVKVLSQAYRTCYNLL